MDRSSKNYCVLIAKLFTLPAGSRLQLFTNFDLSDQSLATAA